MPLLDAGLFRKFHRQRGERYLWWKAVTVENPHLVAGAERDGNLYVLQTLPAAARALFTSELSMGNESFGALSEGNGSISVMPDESYLQRGDRIGRPDTPLIRSEKMTRGAGVSDALSWQPVVSIVSVRREATFYEAGTHFQLTGAAVEWIAGAPASGEIYHVEYLYVPLFKCLEEQRAPRADKRGVLMPQRMSLLLLEHELPNE